MHTEFLQCKYYVEHEEMPLKLSFGLVYLQLQVSSVLT
jgi:hypothetical protein